MSPELAATLFSRGENPLTDREQEVLKLVKGGKNTKEIAHTLYLSIGTVRNYLSTAIQKMEADSRQDAAVRADENGWI